MSACFKVRSIRSELAFFCQRIRIQWYKSMSCLFCWNSEVLSASLRSSLPFWTSGYLKVWGFLLGENQVVTEREQADLNCLFRGKWFATSVMWVKPAGGWWREPCKAAVSVCTLQASKMCCFHSAYTTHWFMFWQIILNSKQLLDS